MSPAWLLLALVAAPVQAPAAPTAIDAFHFSAPRTLRSVAADAVPGDLIRLSPSPDGHQVYVRSSERDRWGNETVHGYLLDLTGNQIETIQTEPEWAEAYWSWKSGRQSPAVPSFALKFESREELVRTINVPHEGDSGMHSGDPNATPAEIAAKAALANQQVHDETLSLHGQVIEHVVNGRVMPGRTFSWSPAPLAFIAYADEKGRLVLMDQQGRRRTIDHAHDVLLPAWSSDGRSIYFFQKKRGGYELRVLAVR